MCKPSRRRFAVSLALTSTAWWTMEAAHALPTGPAANEVESLVGHVSGFTSARFRGGRLEVDSANDARFLRHDLAAKSDRVSSAEEFIRWRPTRSGDTGRAYEVLLPGSVALPTAEMLLDVLRQVRAKRL